MLVYYILGMIITSNVMLYYGKIDIDRRKFMLLEMYMFVCVCVFFYNLLYFSACINVYNTYTLTHILTIPY